MLYCLFDYYPARMAVLWLIGINVFGSARRSITLLLALFFSYRLVFAADIFLIGITRTSALAISSSRRFSKDEVCFML